MVEQHEGQVPEIEKSPTSTWEFLNRFILTHNVSNSGMSVQPITGLQEIARESDMFSGFDASRTTFFPDGVVTDSVYNKAGYDKFKNGEYDKYIATLHAVYGLTTISISYWSTETRNS